MNEHECVLSRIISCGHSRRATLKSLKYFPMLFCMQWIVEESELKGITRNHKLTNIRLKCLPICYTNQTKTFKGVALTPYTETIST